MNKGLRLHPEHGANPTIPKCFFCGKDKNEILLLGAAYKEEAPRSAVWDKEPCDSCRAVMDAGGTLIIEVRDGEEGKSKDNPYRTGNLWGITKEAAARMFKKPVPVAFIEESVAKQLGLHEHLPEKEGEQQ